MSLLLVLIFCASGAFTSVIWSTGGWVPGALCASISVAGVVFLMVRWIAVWPILAVEDVSIVTGISRSNDLTRGHFWIVTAVMLVYGVILLGISIVAGLIGLIPILGQLIAIAVQVLIQPLTFALGYTVYLALKNESS